MRYVILEKDELDGSITAVIGFETNKDMAAYMVKLRQKVDTIYDYECSDVCTAEQFDATLQERAEDDNMYKVRRWKGTDE